MPFCHVFDDRHVHVIVRRTLANDGDRDWRSWCCWSVSSSEETSLPLDSISYYTPRLRKSRWERTTRSAVAGSRRSRETVAAALEKKSNRRRWRIGCPHLPRRSPPRPTRRGRQRKKSGSPSEPPRSGGGKKQTAIGAVIVAMHLLQKDPARKMPRIPLRKRKRVRRTTL